MKLAELVREESVVLDFEASDKWDAMSRLVDHLVARGLLRKDLRKVALEALVAREKIASTGMEHGVAIPHAQVEGLEQPVAAFAIAPKGVPFECADGKPASLIALLVIPRRSIKAHIRTLAGIARLLNYEEMRTALLKTRTPREAADTLAAEEAKEFA